MFALLFQFRGPMFAFFTPQFLCRNMYFATHQSSSIYSSIGDYGRLENKITSNHRCSVLSTPRIYLRDLSQSLNSIVDGLSRCDSSRKEVFPKSLHLTHLRGMQLLSDDFTTVYGFTWSWVILICKSCGVILGMWFHLRPTTTSSTKPVNKHVHCV